MLHNAITTRRLAATNRSHVSSRVTEFLPRQGRGTPCKIFLESSLSTMQNLVAVCLFVFDLLF